MWTEKGALRSRKHESASPSFGDVTSAAISICALCSTRNREKLSEVDARQRQLWRRRLRYSALPLGTLLDAYVAHLKRGSKASKRSVERAIERHVKKAWPEYWNAPAERIAPDDLLAIVAKVADAGKLREAAKLRSYLRAAYAAAIRARQDARGLPALRALRITTNPARDLATIEDANNVRERALSLAELRAYWKPSLHSRVQPAGRSDFTF